MIEIRNVTKNYRRRRLFKRAVLSRGVEDLNLQIQPGAFGLLGINGAGKSTTLKMIATLLRPSSGEILIDGQDSVKNEKKLRASIGMITGSDRMLYFRLTGLENLLYFASLYGMSPREARNRCSELLELTGLSYAAHRRVEEYSRGMKQRLTIARGLINDPKLLLMDEPTLGLDVSIAREIRDFIKEKLLARGDRTIILTSHYMNEIEELCPEIGILQEGKLIYQGDFKGLYNKMEMEEIHRFRIPRRYNSHKSRINSMIGTEEQHWDQDSDGTLILSLDSRRGMGLLKQIDRLALKGLEYSQQRPGLEEAVIRLSKAAVHG